MLIEGIILNTCKHFNPNSVAQTHDGVEPNSDFEYDGEFPYHICMHPQMRQSEALPPCGVAQDQKLCSYYTASDDTVLQVLSNEGKTTHELVTHLTGPGIRTYTVRSASGEVAYSETVHASDDAFEQGLLALEMLQEEHGGEVEQVEDKDNSYLKKVTTV